MNVNEGKQEAAPCIPRRPRTEKQLVGKGQKA